MWQCQKKNLEALSCRLEDRALVRQCQYHASLTTPGMVQHEMGIITARHCYGCVVVYFGQCTYTHTHSLTMLVYMRVVVYFRQCTYTHTHSLTMLVYMRVVV